MIVNKKNLQIMMHEETEFLMISQEYLQKNFNKSVLLLPQLN